MSARENDDGDLVRAVCAGDHRCFARPARSALARVRMRAEADVALADDRQASTAPDPERAFAASSLRAQLESAIDGLEDDQRSVFVMRVVHEASTSETAEALGLSEENVRVRLHRARAALRADLHEAPWPSVHQFAGARCERITQAVMGKLPTSAMSLPPTR